jgi:prepilin-type N-terminal cleavage/methylation domain-containing protein
MTETRRTPRATDRRRRRPHEHGLTLIEMLVAIAVIGGGVLGIVYGFAGAVDTSRVARDQAALQTAMSQVFSVVQSDAAPPVGIPYQACADATYFNGYLRSTTPPPGTAWFVTAVNAFGCGSGARVQEVSVTVTSDGHSLTRAVWKSSP